MKTILQERRKHQRFLIDKVAIEVDFEESQTQIVDLCHILDVSKGGIKLQTERPYVEGQQVTIVFQKAQIRLPVKSEIMHTCASNDRWLAGVKFCEELPLDLSALFDIHQKK